jgi:hypothetical protein
VEIAKRPGVVWVRLMTRPGRSFTVPCRLPGRIAGRRLKFKNPLSTGLVPRDIIGSWSPCIIDMLDNDSTVEVFAMEESTLSVGMVKG